MLALNIIAACVGSLLFFALWLLAAVAEDKGARSITAICMLLLLFLIVAISIDISVLS